MGKKPSPAWHHYTVLVKGRYTRCNHCHKTIRMANGSTGNLFRHLEVKHPSVALVKNIYPKTSLVHKKRKSVKNPTESEKCSNEVVPSTQAAVHINAPDLQRFLSPSKILTNSATVPESPNSFVTVTNSTVLPKFSNISGNLNQQPVSFYLIQACDENKQNEFDKQLLRIIVKNLLPFSIVENHEFRTFVNMLNPSYPLPNREKLLNNVLVSMYESTENELKCALKSIDTVALTIDCWTSVNNEYFIAFTIHYLNNNLELKSNFLQCFSSRQKFSSIDIILIIEELVNNWNLCNKILAVTTDGSEEILKAIQDCNLTHIPCFAQILNQMVESGLEIINPFILKIRNVVQYFRRNSMALNTFSLIQKEMDLSDSKLIKDIPSRWDTTFNMLTSFLKNKVPLLSTIEQLQLNSFSFSSADFHYVENIIKMLVVFNSVKIAMCSENYFSVSKVPFMIQFLSKHLQNILDDSKMPSDIVKMGNIMKARIEQLEELETKQLVCQAVLLDPRFKERGLKCGLFKEACITLQQSVANTREEITNRKSEQVISSETEQNAVVIESEYFIDMWSEFETKEDPLPEQSHAAAAALEVDTFLNDSHLSIEDNPLSYWGNITNQNKFPALFELAKHVLCIPATSIPCEQLYSKVGQIFIKQKKYLPSVNIDKILFLYHNL